MKIQLLLLSILSLISTNYALAEGISGIHFQYGDWEVACDNTRTCRAAGYHSDDDELTISVLLTRKAGAQQPVTGELMIGEIEPLPSFVEMKINDQSIGNLTINQYGYDAQLSESQVTSLLRSLLHTSDIQFTDGKRRWHLSDQGAAAVLLKMDEFQGRVDTQGALVRKGKKSEAHVLPELPAPIIFAATTINKQPSDEDRKILISTLRKSINKDDCNDFFENEIEYAEFSAYQLTPTKWLVSARCFLGNYNQRYSYWVINQKGPHIPVLITEEGNYYSNGIISASHQLRGYGDCRYEESWVWDGNNFVQSDISTSGMCKMVAAGGAWNLPTFVSDVRKQ
jgi:Protein of unknown function (DUF1176)